MADYNDDDDDDEYDFYLNPAEPSPSDSPNKPLSERPAAMALLDAVGSRKKSKSDGTKKESEITHQRSATSSEKSFIEKPELVRLAPDISREERLRRLVEAIEKTGVKIKPSAKSSTQDGANNVGGSSVQVEDELEGIRAEAIRRAKVRGLTGSTPEIKAMKRNNVPVTLENWLAFIYPDGAPEGWETETEIPEEFHDQFISGNDDNTTHS